MRDTLLGAGVTAIVIMPVAVLGAAAPMMRADLLLTEGALGALVSLFFLTGALASIPAGRLSNAVRLRGLIVGASSLSALTLLGVTGWATSWWSLAACLAIGGAANAVGQVAVNQWLARQRPVNRQGLSFGAKQAAVPLASLCAGLLLPAVIVPFGWRAGFLVAAALAMCGVLLVSRVPERRSIHEPQDSALSERGPRGPVLLLTLVGFLGAAGGTCLAPFFVDYAIGLGVGADFAGMLLAMGAASGIGARLLAGLVADTFQPWPLSLIAGLLAIGSLGIGLLATGPAGYFWVPAVILAFAGAWGWPGLLPLALARSSSGAFRRGVGMIVMGPLAGAVAGPLIFGLTVQVAGYEAGWMLLMVVVTAAAVLAATVRLRSQSLHPVRNSEGTPRSAGRST